MHDWTFARWFGSAGVGVGDRDFDIGFDLWRDDGAGCDLDWRKCEEDLEEVDGVGQGEVVLAELLEGVVRRKGLIQPAYCC